MLVQASIPGIQLAHGGPQVSYKSFKPRLVGHSHLELQINSQVWPNVLMLLCTALA